MISSRILDSGTWSSILATIRAVLFRSGEQAAFRRMSTSSASRTKR